MPLVSAYRSSSSPAPATPPSSSGSIDHSPGPPQPQQTRPRLLPRRPCVPADPRQPVAVGCPLPRAAAAPLPAAACPKPPMATQQEVHGRMQRGQTDEVHARHGCPTDHSREGRAVLFMRDQQQSLFSGRASFFMVARAAALRIARPVELSHLGRFSESLFCARQPILLPHLED